MSLRVTQYGEPVLREKGKEIQHFDEDLHALADEMVETMHHEDGIGLAAQQIGKAIQLCVIDVSHLPESELDYSLDGKRVPIDLIMPMALVNPQVEPVSGNDVRGEEGCLSFPGIRGVISRPDRIITRFHDLRGMPHHLEASGWFARVIQHEVDHLNGVLFIDHMETRALRLLETRLKKLKRESRDFMKSLPREES